MITFDGEYTVLFHFELNEEEVLEKGGVNIESLEKNCVQLQDWILSGLSDTIELGENDTCVVIPVEQKLLVNDKEILLQKTAEDYDVTLGDGSSYNETKEEEKEEVVEETEKTEEDVQE